MRVARALAILCLAVPAACQAPGARTGSTSLAGLSLALDGVEGPPPTVQTALSSEFSEAALRRQIDLVGAGSEARYRVKGFLTAEPTPEGGTALAFVWDVFDQAGQRRAGRVTGAAPVRGAGPDPWEGLDREALRRLAQQSVDQIGTLLAAQKGEPADGDPHVN